MKNIVLPPHGYVELLDHCADDLDVAQAAKISYNKHEGIKDSDHHKGLIHYLMKNKHMSPFEMSYFKWQIKAPIFVLRQWVRHRSASINEVSGRYTEINNEYYIPDNNHWRTQVGKQGSYKYEPILSDNAWPLISITEDICREATKAYKKLLDAGVAKEQARIILPLNTYSKIIWSVNARSLMHFLQLRNASDAQYEIRVYAEAMEREFEKIMPITAEAFRSYND